MRVFESRLKNFEYWLYRMARPLIDPLKFVKGVRGYFLFFVDLAKYKSKHREEKISLSDLFPILDEKTALTAFDAHYFYQQMWVFENVLSRKPNRHIDVGSTYQMSGYLSKIVPTTFVDLRPIDARAPNLLIQKGDVLHLPFADDSIPSVSCLHVVEHIGLGRYGDAINPQGSELACRELARVLAPGGHLYFSVPVGKERLCFNAHRVLPPQRIIQYFEGLRLVSFNAVDDAGQYKENIEPSTCSDLSYGCGMFLFEKPD